MNDHEPRSTSRYPRRRVLERAGQLLLGTTAAGPLAAALPALAQNASPSPDVLHEAKSARDKRMRWWRDARFGMFIHWGLYAVPAGDYKGNRITGIGEWIQAAADIPADEYAKYPPQFNPVKFNAAEWVRTAKGAGMKYLVITSKHHDGFALFDSKGTDWDIVDATPYRRDVLRDLSRECRRQGLKFCTYYSILDWHHPSQEHDGSAKSRHAGYANNKMKPGRKAEYVEFMRGQLDEILTDYDPAVLWFDGEWVNWWTEEDGRSLYNWLRSRKPELIINNRIGKGRKGMEGLNKGEGYSGDFGTPEQQIPPTGLPGVDWESCMTMNDTWGYKSFDHNWKSTTVLIRNLVDIASKGGNFLLNVGPTAEGLIPEPSVLRLNQMGEWTRVNGEAIYGTQASPFTKQLPWGRATVKRDRLYLHVFDWPRDGRLSVPGLRNEVKRAYLLADRDRDRLTVQQSGSDLAISLPGTAPDPHASVIVLETRGTPSAG